MFEGILQDLIDELGRFPGIGPKSAQRIAFFVIQDPRYDPAALSELLATVRERIHPCEVCGNLTESVRCSICSDERRDHSVICVVEESKDVAAIERAREYDGVYHVLGGVIDPMNGVGPDQLNVRCLVQRLADDSVTEVILATNSTVEGEATSSYLTRLLQPIGVRITRIASGLPVGADLEFADEITLGRAFAGRRSVE